MRTFAPATPDVDFAHTGPGTLAGRFLKTFWTPVACLDDVRPGRAKPLTIIGERYTYYRGEDGAPHLVGFYCAHRSTQMSTGWVEGDEIRCFYHGWKYDGSGRCIEQPAEDATFASKVSIGGYPVRSYLGFVYAYLGEGDPPPFPYLRVFEGPGHLLPRSFVRHSNYFNGLENACDQLHVNFVHKNSEFTEAGMSREIPRIEAVETEYGMRRNVYFSDGNDRVGHTIMPTTSIVTIYDRTVGHIQHLSYRIPIDDTSHVSFTNDIIDVDDATWESFLEKGRERRRAVAELPSYSETIDRVLRGELHLDDLLDRPDIINLQDDVALASQPPVGSRPMDRLGRSDAQIILLRKIYSREMLALDAGQPLKAWRVPDDLAATAGA